MSQVRIYNFGDTLTHTTVGTVNQKLFPPGVYEGYDLRVVDLQTVELYNAQDPNGPAGYLLLPDGIILSETTTVRFSLPVMPPVPTIYTITATHVDAPQLGGTAATYKLNAGFIAMGSLADSVVIAWIYHPGAGAAFADYMFVLPPKVKSKAYTDLALRLAPDEFWSPVTVLYRQDPPPGGALGHHTVSNTLTDRTPLQPGDKWAATQVYAANTTPGTPSTWFEYSIRCKSKPSRIDIIAKIDAHSLLTPQVFDTDNQVVKQTDETGAVIANFTPSSPTKWAIYSLYIPYSQLVAPNYVPNGTWDPNSKFWRIELGFAIPALEWCLLAGVRVMYDPWLIQA